MMRRCSGVLFVLALLPGASFCQKAQPEYVRVQRSPDQTAVALQTATARFVAGEPDDRLVVDLVAAVHLGDAAYYRELNRQFAQYDVVLYELVAAAGTERPKPEASGDPLSMLLRVARSVIGLESQLEHIDYTKANLVHADLSPKEMWQAMRDRGEDGVTLFLGIAADLLRQANLESRKPVSERRRAPSLDPFDLMFEPGAGNRLKRWLATELSAQASGTGLGRTLETILVRDRNTAAMREFQHQLAKGHRKIALFFGAAHMPDFERRLVEDFGLEKANVHWQVAWDLRASGRTGLEEVLQALGNEFARELERTRPVQPPKRRRRRVRL